MCPIYIYIRPSQKTFLYSQAIAIVIDIIVSCLSRFEGTFFMWNCSIIVNTMKIIAADECPDSIVGSVLNY